MTPLEMAQNCARAVELYADAQQADPVQAHIAATGQRSHSAAQLAGSMALVSIAESLDRIAVLLGEAKI